MRFTSKHEKLLAVITLLILFLAIPATVLFSLQQQILLLHAAGTTCNNTGVTKNPDGSYSFAQLHVDTNGNVVDQNNCVIHLLGLNQGWLASGKTGYPSPQEWASWKQVLPYNIVRINYNSYYWNNDVFVPDKNMNFRAVLQDYVKTAEAHGFYVELDTGAQHPEPPCGGSVTFCSSQNQGAKDYAADPDCTVHPTTCAEVVELPSYPPDGNQSISDLTKLYANDPAVIFDVWNEPGDGNFNTLLPNNQFFPAMQNRITIVNTNAPNSLVVVYAHSFPKLMNGTFPAYTGKNIIIDFHSYSTTQTVDQHIPNIQFDQQHGWGTIINEYGGTNLSASEQQVMTTLAQQYNTGVLFFTADNLLSSGNNLPVVLNALGTLVQTSFTTIFGTVQPTPTFTPTPTPTPKPTTTPTPTPTPVGGLIADDTFVRSNQTFWGKASDGQIWGGDVSSNKVFSIHSNTGQEYNANNSTYIGVLGPSVADAEVLAKVKSTSVSSNNNIGVILRETSTNNYYYAYLNGTQLVVMKIVAGTKTVLTTASFTAVNNTLYDIRFRVIGSTLYAKAWRNSTSEPIGWTTKPVTDTSLSGSGHVGIYTIEQSGVTINYTFFQATQQP